MANRRNRSGKETPEEKTLMVLVVAQELYDETLRLLCKEDLFPKRSRWLMAKDIAEMAGRFLDMGRYANGIKADTPELARKRHNAQREAVALLYALDGKMEAAKRHYQIDADRLKNWAHLYNHDMKLFKAWIDRDDERNSVFPR